MGNIGAKQQDYQQQYQQYYAQSADQSGQIDLSSLDPYKILAVPKNFTWQQLKDAYRHAALKTHPDKEGGNKIAFDFVTTCFKTLAEEYKARNANKAHHDLKKDANEYFEKMVDNNAKHPSDVLRPQTAAMGVINEPFEKRFNKAFDECRYVDEDIQYGYGEMMAKSTGIREEISVERMFSNEKVDSDKFNDAFNKKVPVSKAMIKYKEPEPLIMSKSLKFVEIGAKKPDDYSSRIENNTLAYTDYMKAHSGERLANPDDIKNKKEFRSVEDFEKYRDSKTKRGLTEKERRYMEEKKKKEEKEEFDRQERIRMQNLAIQKAHEKANRLMLK
jgi:curved DNA-binding protein CbpA